jgi:hypothetical protein
LKLSGLFECGRNQNRALTHFCCGHRKFDWETKFFLRAGDYLLLAILTGGEHALRVLALSYSEVTIGVFLMHFQIQYLFQLMMAGIVMRRRPILLQCIAVIVVLGAIAVFVLTQYSGVGNGSFVTPSLVTLQAWGYIWGAALCYAARGVFSGCVPIFASAPVVADPNLTPGPGSYLQQRRLQDAAVEAMRVTASNPLRALYATAQFDTALIRSVHRLSLADRLRPTDVVAQL